MIRIARVASAVVAVLALLLPAVPARAETEAAVNGFARASAVFVPFAVNPNFDFWPVYSLSETDGSFSHGISAGFWPGFLVDATFFQFGYQPFERAFFGVAESAHPIPPAFDSAATTDFAKICQAGEVTKLALPFDMGEQGMPEPMLTGCQSLYNQYRPYVPWKVAAGVSSSDLLKADGSANGAELRFGTITIGAAYASSFTDASNGKATVSGATVLLSDVRIGDTLRIAELRSTVRTVADGTKKGSKVERKLEIVDAKAGDQPVRIDDEGVSTPGGDDLNKELAKQGFEIRVVQGTEKSSPTAASGSTGGLVVRFVRETSGDVAGDADEQCRAFADLQPDPIATVEEDLGENPLHSAKPPYDQLPAELQVEEPLPPQIPCPLLLMERSLDVGLALGGATATSRYQPLPSIDFDFGDDFVDDFVDEVAGFGDGGDLGSERPAGPLLPDLSDVPPVPRDTFLRRGELLGKPVADGVKAIYGGMAALIVLLIAGGRGFKSLMRT